ncbi:Hypothetical protein, putative [Bodo saltans]|uniref:Uncharacterized protein n=1 Tax=Bodo saltans TaxID=75058 RepID=A0A0S4KIZ6_BODSA|nr:Hypothetical protein, putative [Bodo saltans]|eukprot:CUI14506.1 Hypothetical protein, putative [Bodo saltans]
MSIRTRQAPSRRSRSSDGAEPTQTSGVEPTPEATLGDTTAHCDSSATRCPSPPTKASSPWVTTPHALLKHWIEMDRKSAHLPAHSKSSGYALNTADSAAAKDQEHLITSVEERDDAAWVGRTILSEHRARVRHAIMTYPSFLGLEWNLSLDEVGWVQSYCGRLVVGPNIERALSSGNISSHRRQETDAAAVVKVEPPASAAAAADDDALSWVKRSLHSMTQQQQPQQQHVVIDLIADDDEESSPAKDHHDKSASLLFTVPIETVWQQLSTSASIETGSPLDRMLHGGLQCGLVTEVVGFAGVGKTCLVANWIAHAVVRGVLQDRYRSHARRISSLSTTTTTHPLLVLPPPLYSMGNDDKDGTQRDGNVNLLLNGDGGCSQCIVVPVGPNLTARRMHQVVEGTVQTTSLYREALSALSHSHGGGISLDDGSLVMEAEDRIRFVTGVESLDQISSFVLPLLEAHMKTGSIGSSSSRSHGRAEGSPKRLLIIDSFATLVHCSLSADPKESLHRHNILAGFMKRLKSMAEEYQYSIIIVTHATSYAAARSRSWENGGACRPVARAQAHDDDGHDTASVEEMNLSDEPDDLPQAGGPATTSSSAGSVSAFGNTFYHLVNSRIVVDSVVVDGEIKRVLRIIKSPVCPPVTFELLYTPARDSALSHPGVECELGDAELQRATDDLRRSGVHGRGVFRIPNLKYMNQTAHMTPPVWRIH